MNLTEPGAVPTAGPPPVPAASPLSRRMRWDRDRWAAKKLSHTNALYRSIEPTCWETQPAFAAQSSKALCCAASRDAQGAGGGWGTELAGNGTRWDRALEPRRCSALHREHSRSGCHSRATPATCWNGPGTPARTPTPAVLALRQGWGHSPPRLNPKPRSPQKLNSNTGTGAAAAVGKAEFTHSKKQPQDASLDPHKALAPSTSGEAALAPS